MNTPTPRTDAYEFKAGWAAANYGEPWKPMDFARSLERELTALTAERDQLKEKAKDDFEMFHGLRIKLTAACGDPYKMHDEALDCLIAERDQLRAEFEKLAITTAQAQDRNTSYRLERDKAEAERTDAIYQRVCEVEHELRAELATEREKVRVLRSSLENLCDEQNDAPLETRRDQWQLAMDESRLALVVTEDAK